MRSAGLKMYDSITVDLLRGVEQAGGRMMGSETRKR